MAGKATFKVKQVDFAESQEAYSHAPVSKKGK